MNCEANCGHEAQPGAKYCNEWRCPAGGGTAYPKCARVGCDRPNNGGYFCAEDNAAAKAAGLGTWEWAASLPPPASTPAPAVIPKGTRVGNVVYVPPSGATDPRPGEWIAETALERRANGTYWGSLKPVGENRYGALTTREQHDDGWRLEILPPPAAAPGTAGEGKPEWLPEGWGWERTSSGIVVTDPGYERPVEFGEPYAFPAARRWVEQRLASLPTPTPEPPMPKKSAPKEKPARLCATGCGRPVERPELQPSTVASVGCKACSDAWWADSAHVFSFSDWAAAKKRERSAPPKSPAPPASRRRRRARPASSTCTRLRRRRARRSAAMWRRCSGRRAGLWPRRGPRRSPLASRSALPVRWLRRRRNRRRRSL